MSSIVNLLNSAFGEDHPDRQQPIFLREEVRRLPNSPPAILPAGFQAGSHDQRLICPTSEVVRLYGR